MMSPLALLLGLSLLGSSPQVPPPGEGGRWAIGPGHERTLKGALLARGGELQTGWGLRHLSVPADKVEAIYGPSGITNDCDKAPICLRLVHPSSAPSHAQAAGPFSLVVVGNLFEGSSGLVAGVTARLTGIEGFEPFKRIDEKLAAPPPASAASVMRPDLTDADSIEARFRDLVSSDPELVERVERVEVEPHRARFHLRGDGAQTHVVELRPRSPRQSHPAEVTMSFFIQGVGALPDPPDLVARVHAAVGRADDGSLQLVPDHVMARGERPLLHQLLIALSALALVVLLLGARPLARAVGATLGRDRVVWTLLALGVLLRLALPYRMVEMGIGYQLTRLADELLLPRYGAGTVTLHHVIMQIFGSDHVVMVWTHKVLGCLTLPLATAVGARLLGPLRSSIPWAVPAWAGALALTPMLVRSDLTESNLVPVLLGLWAGLLAWQSERGPARIALAAAGLGYAGLCRPEMAVVAPGIWLALERPWRDRRPFLGVITVVALALTLQLFFVSQVVDWEIGAQSLHFTKGLSPSRFAAIVLHNALLDPTIVPVLTPLLALGALGSTQGRGLVVTLLVGGLLWLYVYAVDLSSASQPRLHLVALLPWSLAAAMTLARLAARHRITGVSVALLWLVTAIGTVPTLWAPTNEDTQDVLFERLSDTLPRAEGTILVTLTGSDAPDEPGHYTHRHLPNYRFSEVEQQPIGSMSLALDRSPEGVFYFQGVSCYAQLLRAAKGERGLLPACARVHQRYRLDPLWTDSLPNYGNPPHQELGYYGDDERFSVGLWRVTGLLESPTSPGSR